MAVRQKVYEAEADKLDELLARIEAEMGSGAQLEVQEFRRGGVLGFLGGKKMVQITASLELEGFEAADTSPADSKDSLPAAEPAAVDTASELALAAAESSASVPLFGPPPAIQSSAVAQDEIDSVAIALMASGLRKDFGQVAASIGPTVLDAATASHYYPESIAEELVHTSIEDQPDEVPEASTSKEEGSAGPTDEPWVQQLPFEQSSSDIASMAEIAGVHSEREWLADEVAEPLVTEVTDELAGVMAAEEQTEEEGHAGREPWEAIDADLQPTAAAEAEAVDNASLEADENLTEDEALDSSESVEHLQADEQPEVSDSPAASESEAWSSVALEETASLAAEAPEPHVADQTTLAPSDFLPLEPAEPAAQVADISLPEASAAATLDTSVTEDTVMPDEGETRSQDSSPVWPDPLSPREPQTQQPLATSLPAEVLRFMEEVKESINGLRSSLQKLEAGQDNLSDAAAQAASSAVQSVLDKLLASDAERRAQDEQHRLEIARRYEEELTALREAASKLSTAAQLAEQHQAAGRESAQGMSPVQQQAYDILLDWNIGHYDALELLNNALVALQPGTAPTVDNLVSTVSDEICRNVLLGEGIRLGRTPPGKAVALIGPTGVGKTTTIAKLAAAFAFQQGKRVSLISMDNYRIAAAEQLRTYSDIMGLDLDIVFSKEEFDTVLSRRRSSDLILIDTAGRSPNNPRHLQELRDTFAAHPPDEVHLVIAAGTRRDDMRLILEAFRPLGFDHIIVSKLDETRSLGALYNLTKSSTLPISYFAVGQSVPEDLRSATLPFVKQWIAQGRVL